jgi:hypothetical protein
MRFTVCLALLVFIIVMQPACASAQAPGNTLQPPSAFASIADPAERSRAIFTEAAKVLGLATVWTTKLPCIQYVFYLTKREIIVPNRLSYINISVKCEARALTFESEKEL